MSENDLNKSKIININDFIFRQNLEFYPNLNGLSCEDNILTYKEDGHVVTGESLTFDLRTLPGKVWNMTPMEFIEIIRLNKDCLSLVATAEYINKQVYGNFMNPIESLETIKKQTEIYYIGANNRDLLCENANTAVGYYENNVIRPFEERKENGLLNGPIDESIEAGVNAYLAKYPDQREKKNALERTRKLSPVLNKEEPSMPRKTGFINVAIVLYGILNIGIIVAMAIMK